MIKLEVTNDVLDHHINGFKRKVKQRQYRLVLTALEPSRSHLALSK